MIVYIQHTNSDGFPRLRYVLDFIEKHPQVGGNLRFSQQITQPFDAQIDYGTHAGGQWFIPKQKLMFSNFDTGSNKWIPNRYKWKKHSIYSVEKIPKKDQAFLSGSNFSFDIFETIFFHISRYEEFFVDTLNINKHGMVDNHSLFLAHFHLEKLPVVDILVFAFCQSLGLKIKPLKTEYILTHDIDKIYKYQNLWEGLKSFLRPIVYTLDFRLAFANLQNYFNKVTKKTKDPYDSYDFLFRSNKVWKKKEVYFMAGANSRFDLYDKNYRKHFKRIWKKAKSKDYEAALHPSYHSAANKEIMEREKRHLEQVSDQKIRLVRQHFLHYLPGKTDKIFDALYFECDSSLGYNRLIGFRCGTGFSYKLYDFELEKAFAFSEQPLVVMDSSLVHESGDDMVKFEQILFDFLEQNRQFTQICFNFHNSTFDHTLVQRRKMRSIYEKIESWIATI